jgi:hypothetical protein
MIRDRNGFMAFVLGALAYETSVDRPFNLNKLISL